MFMKLKKSSIYNWWIAEDNNVMGFVNIFNKSAITKRLIVVGYLSGTDRELATSTNRVVKITEKGVITEKGTFYPFVDANDIYLQYLIECNDDKNIVAKSWKWINSKTIRANIIRDDKYVIDLEIDFKPNVNSTGVFVSGYSNQLKANIIVPPFREGDYCLILAIPEEIKKKICRGWVVSQENAYRTKRVKEIFKRKFKSPYNL